MNNPEVIILTKLSLKDAVAKNKFWGDSYEPAFSKNKAKWMLENTRADDNDVIAILGYEKHTIIAFVYLVPDLIKLEDSSVKKIFWSQRWWVADKYKDTVLSTYAKNMSLNESNSQVVIKFLGDKSKAYYEKQPYAKFSKRKRYIILFSLDYGLLIHKKNSLKKITPILKFADEISRRIFASINKRKSRINNKVINYQSVPFIDDDTWNFIAQYTSNDIVPKRKDYINWQISNYQYHVITDNENEPNYRCLLGTISKKKYNLNFVVKNENEIVGFVSGLVSENRFIVRYFLSNEAHYYDCIKVLIKALISSKCTLLQTENSELGECVISTFFKVYKDVKALVSLVHNDVNVDLKDSIIKDQDGNFF